uniref:Uncharacterized protein n=1 Tax=Bactrocera latifrons TaxID=174628 RepID=A0A0K8VX60_BACLA
MSNSKDFQKSLNLGNSISDNQDTNQSRQLMSSSTSADNRRMSSESRQAIGNGSIYVSPTLVLPQPPEFWLFGQSQRDCMEELNEDDTKMAKTTFDYYNLKKLLRVLPQPSNSSEPSTLPHPPQHWLIERTEYGSKKEESEEEQVMAKKTDTFDYYNLKKLLYVGSYGRLGNRNSPQPCNSASNVPLVSALPQPPRHWLLGEAQTGSKEDEMERELARIASTYDFYNLKMLLTGE